MNCAWLVLVALAGWQPTPAFAQLQVKESSNVKLPQLPLGHITMPLSPDGRVLAVTYGDQGPKGYSVSLLDSVTGKEQAALEAHAFEITCAAFNADGTQLATGSLDRTIKVWDTKTRKQSVVLRGYAEPKALAFSSDGKTLATVGRSGTVRDLQNVDLDQVVIRLWDVSTGKERANLICFIPGSRGFSLTKLCFSPNGKRLWAGRSDGPGYFWDVEAERLVSDAVGDDNSNLVFSPDSKLILTGYDKLVIRDGDSGKEKEPLQTNGYALAFSANGKVLAVDTKKGIELVNAVTGKSFLTLVEETAPSDRKVVFSPDGKTVSAWVRTGKEVAIKTWELTWDKETAK